MQDKSLFSKDDSLELYFTQRPSLLALLLYVLDEIKFHLPDAELSLGWSDTESGKGEKVVLPALYVSCLRDAAYAVQVIERIRQHLAFNAFSGLYFEVILDLPSSKETPQG